MRLLFLGSGAFGLPSLQALANHHQVLAVVSQPDKPAGRGMKLTPTPIAQWAADHLPTVPLYKPSDVNQPDTLAALRAYSADAWVVIAFGQKLSEPLLEGRFAVNLHASILPRWRGAAPINAAMLAGDTHTGNSVITLAQRMDAGLVLATSRRAIDPLQTAGELHDALAADGPDLLLSVLHQHSTSTLKPLAQDESLVTRARKLSKADGQLTPADFNASAAIIRQRVHALTPWPGVTATVDGQPLKLLRVQEATSARTHPPGTLIDPDAGLIACGPGTALRLIEVHPPGGKPMTWDAYRRGRGPR